MNQKSGRYVVPPEILALAPKDIPCQIEVQHYRSVKKFEEGGQDRIYYYVYENRTKIPHLPSSTSKPHGRMLLGRIIDNKFVPNAKGALRIEEIRAAIKKNAPKHPVAEKPVEPPPTRPYLAYPHSMDLEIKNYGEYALVLSCTEDIYQVLQDSLSEDDALYAYVLGILCFLGDNQTYSCFHELFTQSILSIRWPNLSLEGKDLLEALATIGKYGSKLEGCRELLLPPGSDLEDGWNQLEQARSRQKSIKLADLQMRSVFRESLPPLDINQHRGLKFLSIVTFRVRSAFEQQLQKTDPRLITLPSVDVVLMAAASLKISMHRNRTVHIARPSLDLLYIFYVFGIDIDEDLKSLQFDYIP